MPTMANPPSMASTYSSRGQLGIATDDDIWFVGFIGLNGLLRFDGLYGLLMLDGFAGFSDHTAAGFIDIGLDMELGFKFRGT